MSDTPFYINSEGKNEISNVEIKKFKQSNPEISEFVDKYIIQLKLIKYDDLTAYCYWIIGQQISGISAQSIINRFNDFFTEITPSILLSTTTEQFRLIGLSKGKASYIHNLAKFFQSSSFPFNYQSLSSQKIIDIFTQIKGIGEWTVQMHLIFSIGKKNILAAKDLVVRKGIAKMYNLEVVPSEKEIYIICKKWGDLATIGTILSWAVMGE